MDPWQYRWRGITFGNFPGSGLWVTQHPVVASVQADVANGKLPRDDGDFVGTASLNGRVDRMVVRASNSPLPYADVAQAFRPGGDFEDELLFSQRPGVHPDSADGTGFLLRARIARREPLADKQDWTGRYGFALELRGADPRYYGSARRVTVPSFDAPRRLMAWPAAWPVPWASTTPTSLAAGFAQNAGWETAWPVIQISALPDAAGPITSFEVRNDTTGVRFTFTGIDIPPTKTLVVDMDAYQRRTGGGIVTMDSASLIGGWVEPNVPFGLAPGFNTIRFEHDGPAGPGDVACTMSYRDTYL